MGEADGREGNENGRVSQLPTLLLKRSEKRLLALYGHDSAEGIGEVLTATVRHDPLVDIIGNGVHVTLTLGLGSPATRTGSPTFRN